MNKISFPKGSLKFEKIMLKPNGVKFDFKSMISRKNYSKQIEDMYPNTKKVELPSDIYQSLLTNQAELKKQRKILNDIKYNGFNNSYKIIFKHPKWYPIVGDITVSSDKEGLKKTLEVILEEFRLRKANYRMFRNRNKNVHIESLRTDINYNISGGCIFMPSITQGVFLKFLKDQERKIVFSPKYPRETNEKYVGVELEFLCPIDKDMLGGKLYDAGLGRHITLTDDHSIKCSHNTYPSDCNEHKGNLFAHELCIISKENEYKEIFVKVCKVLNDEQAIVNKSCGMHVHIDCRNRDAEKVFQNLMSSQGVLLQMNPKSRIEKFAKKNVERDFEYAMRNGGNRDGSRGEGRYYAINALAYAKHKTIEVRAHAGTVDFTKITNWVAILISVANIEERYTRNFNVINTFCKRFAISAELQAYIQERVDKFQIKIEDEREIIPEAERGVA